MAVATPAKRPADSTAADAARLKSLLPQVFENELHERVEAMRAELRSEIQRELERELEKRLDSIRQDEHRAYQDKLGACQRDCENDLEHRASEAGQPHAKLGPCLPRPQAWTPWCRPFSRRWIRIGPLPGMSPLIA